MDDSTVIRDNDQIVAALLELLRRFERGEIRSAVLRVEHADGAVEDVALGFETELERDSAIARLHRLLRILQ